MATHFMFIVYTLIYNPLGEVRCLCVGLSGAPVQCGRSTHTDSLSHKSRSLFTTHIHSRKYFSSNMCISIGLYQICHLSGSLHSGVEVNHIFFSKCLAGILTAVKGVNLPLTPTEAHLVPLKRLWSGEVVIFWNLPESLEPPMVTNLTRRWPKQPNLRRLMTHTLHTLYRGRGSAAIIVLIFSNFHAELLGSWICSQIEVNFWRFGK